MFDFIRQHKRIMQLLLVILIFPSFVLFGIDGYKRFTSESEVLVTIDGQDITLAEVDKLVQIESNRITRQNPSIDPKLFDSPIYRSQVLDQLINDRVLQLAASKFHVHVSDAKLARAIQSSPEFQLIKGPNGEIQRDSYTAFLSAQGLTPQNYEANLRASLMSDFLIQSSGASTLSESISAGQNSWSQSRDISWTRIDYTKYLRSIQPNEAELKNFFEANRNQFMAQETIQGEWVVLSAAQVAQKIELKGDDVKSYFQQNVQTYSIPEQRRARHILISLKRDASASEIELARAKIEEIRNKLIAAPSSFEALAKSQSQDTGSVRQGGDLGFFSQKDMVKPFSDAAFSLTIGEISPVVQTEFGLHVIQLTEIKSGQAQSFESVKSEIERQLKSQLAQKRFAELAEQFTNMVYEQPDSLEPAAKQLGLEIRRFPATSRVGTASIAPELNHPKVLEAMFSADGLASKRNSAAIDVGSSTLVSVRVTDHQPRRQLEFIEAKRTVIDRFNEIEALKKAKLEADQLLMGSRTSLSESASVSRLNTYKLSQKVINAVMRQPIDQLPSRFIVDEGASGIYVIEFRSVMVEAEPGKNEMSKLLMQKSYSDAQVQAYIHSLRQLMNVKFKSKSLESKSS